MTKSGRAILMTLPLLTACLPDDACRDLLCADGEAAADCLADCPWVRGTGGE